MQSKHGFIWKYQASINFVWIILSSNHGTTWPVGQDL